MVGIGGFPTLIQLSSIKVLSACVCVGGSLSLHSKSTMLSVNYALTQFSYVCYGSVIVLYHSVWNFYALQLLCFGTSMLWNFYALELLCFGASMLWNFYALELLCFASSLLPAPSHCTFVSKVRVPIKYLPAEASIMYATITQKSHAVLTSLVPRPRPAFRRLQYGLHWK